ALAGYRSLRHPVRAASLTSGNGRGVRDYARRGRLDLRLGGRRQNVASNMAKTVTTSRRPANIRKVSMARLPECMLSKVPRGPMGPRPMPVFPRQAIAAVN